MKNQINEQAAKLKDYKIYAFNIEDDILNHISYILLYDDTENLNHWKTELYGFCSRLKNITLKSGDKEKVTYTALVEVSHGMNFCEELENPFVFFGDVYDSKETPRHFDYNMTNEKNIDLFFDALNKFYSEFLVPWIASDNGGKHDLYNAIERYLVSIHNQYI